MNILLISTWKTECGIATYTEYLAKALQSLGHEITIFAEAKQKDLSPYKDFEDFNVYRIWKRSAAFESQFGLKSIFDLIQRSNIKPNIIHIQHEFGLFPDNSAFWALVV